MPAQEQELFGLPQVLINFRTKGTTAIKRSAMGIVAMILHNESKDEIHNYTIRDVSDIPETGLTDENVDLIKKCLLGTPLRVLVYTLPLSTVEGATKTQANVLKMLANIKWNWLCAPTATTQEQNDLASWIKTQRTTKRKLSRPYCLSRPPTMKVLSTSARTISRYRLILTVLAILSIQRIRRYSIQPVLLVFWQGCPWTAALRILS